eukprot:SAG11_NODE_2909_length_2845_cov_3.209395_1_plen_103_part_00
MADELVAVGRADRGLLRGAERALPQADRDAPGFERRVFVRLGCGTPGRRAEAKDLILHRTRFGSCTVATSASPRAQGPSNADQGQNSRGGGGLAASLRSRKP